MKPEGMLRVGNCLIRDFSCLSTVFFFCAHVTSGYNSAIAFFLFSLQANEAGETPLDIARRLKHLQCEELVRWLFLCSLLFSSSASKNTHTHQQLFVFLYIQLNQALAGKFNAHVHVEYEWCLQHEDLDESDEDLDEKVGVGVFPVKRKCLDVEKNVWFVQTKPQKKTCRRSVGDKHRPYVWQTY